MSGAQLQLQAQAWRSERMDTWAYSSKRLSAHMQLACDCTVGVRMETVGVTRICTLLPIVYSSITGYASNVVSLSSTCASFKAFLCSIYS